MQYIKLTRIIAKVHKEKLIPKRRLTDGALRIWRVCFKSEIRTSDELEAVMIREDCIDFIKQLIIESTGDYLVSFFSDRKQGVIREKPAEDIVEIALAFRNRLTEKLEKIKDSNRKQEYKDITEYLTKAPSTPLLTLTKFLESIDSDKGISSLTKNLNSFLNKLEIDKEKMKDRSGQILFTVEEFYFYKEMFSKVLDRKGYLYYKLYPKLGKDMTAQEELTLSCEFENSMKKAIENVYSQKLRNSFERCIERIANERLLVARVESEANLKKVLLHIVNDYSGEEALEELEKFNGYILEFMN